MQITFTTSDYHGYNVSCFGSKDGSIAVNVTGGTPPYSYQWSNDQNTETITGLSADFYNVVVTDSTGESADFGVNLTSPGILKPILTAYEYNNGYNISLYGASNGSITTTIDGGVSPFTFQWEDGPATQNRAQLGGGFYSLIVTDANNCLANVQTTLSEPERDDWTMGGNANTNPANNFIGTTDNKDLVFKTNGQERMRMLGNGNMRVHALADSGQGIISVDSSGNLFRSNIYIGHLSAQGNTPEIFSYGKAPDPGTLGTICNPTSLYSPVTHQFLGMMESYNISSQNGLYNVLRFGSDSQHGIIDADGFIGYGQTAGQNSALLLNYYCGNDVLVGNSTSGNLIAAKNFITHGTSKLDGKVGIGTDPSTSFSLKVNGEVSLGNSNSTNGIEIVMGHAPYRRGIRTDADPTGNLDFYINTWQYDAAFNFIARTGDANGTDSKLFTIREDGKVGIGISENSDWDGNYSLYVINGIRAEKIKVDLPAVGWGDYVFQNNYKLFPLDKLGEFVSAFKHLPNIPSANTLNENGLDIGEMQAMQMEKIEELTLYILQLKKEIDELKCKK